MSQKNKIFSITLSLLILGSVACRKSGGGGTTQTDPIKNLTGNLLIVSADGTQGANSLPLSFAGASATVSDVKVEQFGLQGGDILLFPTNFIIENGNLYLTNLTKTNDKGVDIEAGKTNSKVTLTFSLSGENLSRYTDTAEIFVGKYSNISTNILDTFKQFNKITADDLNEIQDTTHITKKVEFNFANMTNATTNSSFLLLENISDGDDMLVNGARFVTNLNNSIAAQKTSFDTYFTDVKVNGFNTNDNESIANFQIDFSGKKSYLYYYEGEPNYHLIFFLKKGKWDNNLGK